MNEQQFSFNVFEYSINELENLLKLKSNYLIEEIEKNKDIQIQKILKTESSEKFKKKIIHFMNEISLILRFNYQTHKYSTYPTQIVESKSNVNPTLPKTSTFTKTLAFNTLFRNNNLKTTSNSNDCEFILPVTIKNVTSLTLSSLEFPCSYYSLSDSLQNNVLYIKEDTTNITAKIILPEGNYTSGPLLAESLTLSFAFIYNDIINGYTYNRFNVLFDEIKGKITISNSKYTFTMELIVVPQMKLYNTFGWLLGFREVTYTGLKSYTSETILKLSNIEYIFFYLNDYHVSTRNSVIGIFNDSYIETNILAKIPITVDAFNYVINNNSDLISKERQFFSPVDIDKIHIKIYNKYGDILFMNYMDFSFSIQCKILYDL